MYFSKQDMEFFQIDISNIRDFDIKINLLFESYATYISKGLGKFSIDEVHSAFIENKEFLKKMAEYFLTRFNPHSHSGDYNNQLPDATSAILHYLYMAINATVRTNFFCDTSLDKPYIALKFDSAKIRQKTNLLFENFIFSYEMEGIHMRSSRVARGGIRWSSRLNDYPVEVYDLVTAQIQKNAAIIPSGSKGGFIYKGEQTKENSLRAYEVFVNGLLDITDNIVNGNIVHAVNVKRFDDEDTYLVIAADKGTATFSDYANSISQKRGYWLGDAFASGGSNGYDHKKIGITSLGSLVASKHQFATIGVDLYKDSISVIGVGGMSGDVFGNGMTILKNIRLIAAFSHSHIFIDPQPNIVDSYNERQRLFDNVLSWKDYDVSKISQGGGVFKIADAEIALSYEIRQLLGVDISCCSGEELVRYVLMSKADFLFFGGIGTFVKSSEESNIDARDKANDSMRIDAVDLNVKVISEGANLAMTRNARIEAARKGILLNTDAVDNFSGVNCSDHEVILKILLKNQPDCDEILRLVQADVIRMILNQNESRNLAILLDTLLSSGDMYRNMLNFLHNKGLLNASVFLSNIETFGSLTRPEICEIMSIAQIYLKSYLHNLLNDEMLLSGTYDKYFIEYFPEYIVQNSAKFNLLCHPLKKDIIISEMTNKLLSSVSISFVFDLLNNGVDLLNLFCDDFVDLDAIYKHNMGLISVISRATTINQLLDTQRNIQSKLCNI